MRISSVVVVASLALILGGCAQPPEAPDPTPTLSESATPTPTPTVATKPALSDLVVYPGGIDYVKVGVPVEQRDEEVAVVLYNANGCESEPNRIIGWESTYGLGTFDMVTNADSTIRGIAVRTDAVHTATGIHIGSTVEDIRAAYGDAATVTEAQITDLYSVTGPDGVLVFEVATERDFDGGDYGARAGTVLWMLVLAPDSEPFSIAYGAYGACI